MDSCYSGDRIDGNHIYTGITTCNIGEAQQKYRFGMVRNKLLGGVGSFNMFYWIKNLDLCFCSGPKHLVCMKVYKSINESIQETKNHGYVFRECLPFWFERGMWDLIV